MIRIIRKAVALLGYHLKLWFLCFFLYRIKTGKPMLVVFTFHRVTSVEKSAKFYMYYEKGLDHRTFSRQIDAIAKYFQVVDLDEFVDILNGRRSPARPTALITFDDADYDFIEYALPYLRERKMPTVMFAPTGFIETDNRFWHLRVSNMIHKLNRESWAIMKSQADLIPDSVRALFDIEFPDTEKDKAAFARSLNHHLDKENIEITLRVIENWETLFDREFVLDIKCMNWDELRNINSNNVAVESHSVSHGKLGQLHSRDIETELFDSKARIEKELGKTVKAISYPAGSYNRQVLEIAPGVGYEVGFVTEYGFCSYPAEGTDKYRLPRYSLYGDTDLEIHYTLGLMALKGSLGIRL